MTTEPTLIGRTNAFRTFLVYGAMLVAAVGLFFLVRSEGEGLVAPAAAPSAAVAAVVAHP